MVVVEVLLPIEKVVNFSMLQERMILKMDQVRKKLSTKRMMRRNMMMLCL
jgi:hypothetical protein